MQKVLVTLITINNATPPTTNLRPSKCKPTWVVRVAELLTLPVTGRPKPSALHVKLLLAEILRYMACTYKPESCGYVAQGFCHEQSVFGKVFGLSPKV